MIKKKFNKIALVLLCVITLVMPHLSTVLAAGLSQSETSALLEVRTMHEGGEEGSGTLTAEQLEHYDTNPYIYEVGTVKIFKIVTAGDNDYENSIYCLNATRSFPGVTASGNTSLEYFNEGSFKDPTNTNVKALHLGVSSTEDSTNWTKNYNAINWLINNFYLKKQTPEQKDSYLAKAFEGYTTYNLDVVKAFLTDDDIEIVQQAALWYFSNGDNTSYSGETLPAVTLTDPLSGTTGSYGDVTGSNLRQELADYLYKYLIRSALEGTTTTEVTYPELLTTEGTVSENDEYFILGPVKYKSGTASTNDYTIKVYDQTGRELTRNDYAVVIEGEDHSTDRPLNEIMDVNYYIYIPKSNETITNVELRLSYTNYETEATLWENNTVDDDTHEKVYQPVVLLTREEAPHNIPLNFKIVRKVADLALRKYVVSINGEAVNRAPVVDVTALKSGAATTATYKHAKSPLKVSSGDTVVYEIRVYNEGDAAASGVIVLDTLPAGLELIENNEINTTYGWEPIRTGSHSSTYKSTYLETKTIAGFNKETDTELHSEAVQIACKVTTNLTSSATLTNVAEIGGDNIKDIDSEPMNNDYTNNDYDNSDYTGNNTNKSDLTDTNYHYKGIEDDDDFEKVAVEGKTFDLNLKKFVSKINMRAPATNREPKVDTTKLKNKTARNADYEMVKGALKVEPGDIVLYTLRVYNEGEIDGYADQITEFIPEGLGFLVNYKTNYDYGWKLEDGISQNNTLKLKDVTNGKKNLSVDDFNGVQSLDDVEVVKGKVKVTTEKLKANGIDDTNLIKAYDGGDKLNYKDVQIACIVLTNTISNNNLRNVAEISREKDKNGNEIEDRDSTPGSITDPDNYPGNDANQDDHDYENLTPEEFDLSLKKFITKLNETAIKGREPQIVQNAQTGEKKVESAKVNPLDVENLDLITYTIRVYNEGNTDGYAAEISDTIPTGLVFQKDHETNKKYGWKMYDKNGNETTNISQAVTVKTDYLSKDKESSAGANLIKAYDSTDSSAKISYKDVELVFKVDYSALPDKNKRDLENIAEITKDTDKDGNDVTDRDSTPGNNKAGEDDIDNEKVHVKCFNLALEKNLSKIIVTEDGVTREINVKPTDGLQKVEIHRKKIEKTEVRFVYTITVKNVGEINGYATEIKDYIPDGLEFIDIAENKHWTTVKNSNVITTNALQTTELKPGQTASVTLTLKWKNAADNINLKTNAAEISKDKNDSNTPDINSTPDNKKPEEDDYDTAEVFLAISTGTSQTYFSLAFAVLAILATGVALIKKFVV